MLLRIICPHFPKPEDAPIRANDLGLKMRSKSILIPEAPPFFSVHPCFAFPFLRFKFTKSFLDRRVAAFYQTGFRQVKESPWDALRPFRQGFEKGLEKCAKAFYSARVSPVESVQRAGQYDSGIFS
jgi:hypothetical protein